jgi:hypothetical protein
MAARNHGNLPLQRDADSSKFDTVKHSVTPTINYISSKTQAEIPKLSIRASRMEQLYFITEFSRSAKTMRWTIGPILYEKFPMHIQVSDLDTWNILIINAARLVLQHALLLSRKASFMKMPMTGRSTFYVSSRNPRKWSLQHSHNILLAELPGAPKDPNQAKFSYADMG